MIIEILKYGFMALVAGMQVLIAGMFLLGFWNGFTYESGEAGSKYHMWFKLLPFKRFFKKKPTLDSDAEKWVRRAVSATFKGFADWMQSDDCKIRYKDTLVDVTDEVEIYSLSEDKGSPAITNAIHKSLEEYGIIWHIEKSKEKE